MLPDISASTSTSYHKPAFYKGKDKDKKDNKGNGKGVIKAKAAQIDTDVESDASESNDSDAERSADENALWRDGYYCYAIRHAEQTEHFFRVCFNCRDERHRWHNCDQPLRPALQEIKDKIGVDGDWLNVFGDDRGQGSRHSQKGSKGTEGQGGGPAAKTQKVKSPRKTPYWNDDLRACWLGPLNLGNAFIDGNWTKVLLDDGSQINSITPAYAKSLDLVVGPLEELAGDLSGQTYPGDRRSAHRCNRVRSLPRADRGDP